MIGTGLFNPSITRVRAGLGARAPERPRRRRQRHVPPGRHRGRRRGARRADPGRRGAGRRRRRSAYVSGMHDALWVCAAVCAGRRRRRAAVVLRDLAGAGAPARDADAEAGGRGGRADRLIGARVPDPPIYRDRGIQRCPFGAESCACGDNAPPPRGSAGSQLQASGCSRAATSSRRCRSSAATRTTSRWLDAPLPTAVLLLAIALVLLRAVRVPQERAFCLALAAAIASGRSATSPGSSRSARAAPRRCRRSPTSASSASTCRPTWRSACCCGRAARGSTRRCGSTGSSPGLTVAAVAAAVAVRLGLATRPAAASRPSRSRSPTRVADLLVLALIAGTLVLHGGRPMRSLVVLGAGLVVFAIGDSLFMFLTASGDYADGHADQRGVAGRLRDHGLRAVDARRGASRWSGRARRRAAARAVHADRAGRSSSPSRFTDVPTLAFALACAAIAAAVAGPC